MDSHQSNATTDGFGADFITTAIVWLQFWSSSLKVLAWSLTATISVMVGTQSVRRHGTSSVLLERKNWPCMRSLLRTEGQM